MINLISDTVTQPSAAMRIAMMEAEVGDDVFGEDPSINALEAKMATMFGHEAALYCPSGTMTNQIAIKIHTHPLDEIICDHYSHIYQYETGGYAFNSGVAINLLEGQYGKITADQIQKSIKQDYDWLPSSKLVVIENSCNKGGGSYYTLEEMEEMALTCSSNNLKLHLDGARLFNVLVETKDSTQAVGGLFDSISICLSKGLGAPVGSVLIGNKQDIKLARRYRKVMGGGMRQAGMLAAAGIYALDNNVERLKIDNQRAREVGKVLQDCSSIKFVRPVQTNIVIFELDKKMNADQCVSLFKEQGILLTAFGPQAVRMVFHMDVSQEDFSTILETIPQIMA